MLKDTYVTYITSDEKVHSVMLFDREFTVQACAAETEGIRHGLKISNTHRELMLKCWSDEECEQWSVLPIKCLNAAGARRSRR